jgi:LCP family protein required for cell wall assembly
VALLKVLRPLLAFHWLWRHHEEEREREEHRKRLLKRTAIVLAAVLCALLLLAGTAKALVALRIVSIGSLSNVAGTQPATDDRGQINILLLGQGDRDHEGTDLTDAIIVASIDSGETRSVVLLSLPRDTYFLRTEHMGRGRINSLYRDYKGYLRSRGKTVDEASLEAMRELAAEVGTALGLEIPHAVKVNFTAFQEIVDAVSGIDVFVPEEIVDTEYPDASYGFETFTLPAGLQHLDGATALKYVRSRHSTSDFSRSARQQQVLAALGKKVRDEDLHRDVGFITSLLSTLSQHLETTLSLREIVWLSGLGSRLDPSRVIALQMNDRNGLYEGFVEPGGLLYTPPRDQFDGASVLLPVSLPEFPVTWKQPQTLVELLTEHRELFLDAPRIAVLNAGARSGLGRRLGSELIRYGFAVPVIENASLTEKLPRSLVAAGSPDASEHAAFLSSLLGLPLGALPPDLPPPPGEVILLLGQDYAYRPLLDLLPLLAP